MKLTRIPSHPKYVAYADLKAGSIYRLEYNDKTYTIGMVVEHSWATDIPAKERYDKFFVNLLTVNTGDAVGQMWKIQPGVTQINNINFILETGSFNISND